MKAFWVERFCFISDQVAVLSFDHIALSIPWLCCLYRTDLVEDLEGLLPNIQNPSQLENMWIVHRLADHYNQWHLTFDHAYLVNNELEDGRVLAQVQVIICFPSISFNLWLMPARLFTFVWAAGTLILRDVDEPPFRGLD